MAKTHKTIHCCVTGEKALCGVIKGRIHPAYNDFSTAIKDTTCDSCLHEYVWNNMSAEQREAEIQDRLTQFANVLYDIFFQLPPEERMKYERPARERSEQRLTKA